MGIFHSKYILTYFFILHIPEKSNVCVSSTVCHKFSKRSQSLGQLLGVTGLVFFPLFFGPQHLTPATAEYSPLQTSVSNFIVCLNIYKMKTKRLPCMLAGRGTCLLFSAQLNNFYVAWLKDL